MLKGSGEHIYGFEVFVSQNTLVILKRGGGGFHPFKWQGTFTLS